MTASSPLEQALAGYEGHLDASQQAAFDDFKKEIEAELEGDKGEAERRGKSGEDGGESNGNEEAATNGENTSEKEPATWYDDTTLLRFLRARKFNIPAAKKQFLTTHGWRKEYKPYQVFSTFPAEEMESSKAYYPRWTGRRDKMGNPLYVYKIGAINKAHQKELFGKTEERRYQNIVALTEGPMHFNFPLLSQLPSPSHPTPISSVTSIIDLAGISLGLIWTLRAHLQQSMTLSSAHYPETLGTIAVVNAPSFFPIIWNSVIKRAFDEGTRNKIHVLGSQPGPELQEIIAIEDLPKVYGGELDWKYEDEPILQQEIRDAIGMDQVPPGPLVWRDNKVVALTAATTKNDKAEAEKEGEKPSS